MSPNIFCQHNILHEFINNQRIPLYRVIEISISRFIVLYNNILIFWQILTKLRGYKMCTAGKEVQRSDL